MRALVCLLLKRGAFYSGSELIESLSELHDTIFESEVCIDSVGSLVDTVNYS